MRPTATPEGSPCLLLLSICPSFVFPPINLSYVCSHLGVCFSENLNLTEVNLHWSNNTGVMWGPQIAPLHKVLTQLLKISIGDLGICPSRGETIIGTVNLESEK